MSSSGVMVLTNINPLMLIEIAHQNLTFQTGFSYRTLESASDIFSLDYYTDAAMQLLRVM
jgi:hypothetical protein